MGLRNIIALPGMLTPIAAPAAGQDIVWQHETLRTSGSGYDQPYNLMDAGDFAQNPTVECFDLCGDVTGDGVIDIKRCDPALELCWVFRIFAELHHIRRWYRKISVNPCLKILSDTD